MSHQFDSRPSVLYENRYCDQTEFDIIINHEGKGSKYSTKSVISMKSADVKFNVVLIPILALRCFAKTAVIGSDIFVIRGFDKVRKLPVLMLKPDASGKN